jgi:cellulose synthase/poly-beta-1,6-N-acetylglucosamine synthase-like glycosyltransferase
MINPDWFPILRNITIFFASAMLVKYFIFLVTAPFHTFKEQLRVLRVLKQAARDPKQFASYQPLVTVIIPAWNEEVGVLKTIRSVLDNTYQNTEVIVVNDGSTDRTHDIVEQFMRSAEVLSRKSTVQIRYFSKDNEGKGTALNYGIERANGDIILTVDADSALESNAISSLVRYFADQTVDAVVGNVKVATSQTGIGLLQYMEYMFGFYFKRSHSVLGAEYILGGACAAFRKSRVFEQIGLFDTSTKTEDIDLSVRIRYHGMHTVYAEDVICYTEGASTITGLINQRLRWKKGRFDAFVKYRSLFFSLDRRHNRFLSWFVLPYAVFSDLQLLFEPIGISLLLTYSIVSGDYISLALGIAFVFLSYLVTALFNHRKIDMRVLALFPVTWPWFYFLVWVEFLALVKSLLLILRGNDITWQKWERTGIEVTR